MLFCLVWLFPVDLLNIVGRGEHWSADFWSGYWQAFAHADRKVLSDLESEFSFLCRLRAEINAIPFIVVAGAIGPSVLAFKPVASRRFETDPIKPALPREVLASISGVAVIYYLGAIALAVFGQFSFDWVSTHAAPLLKF